MRIKLIALFTIASITLSCNETKNVDAVTKELEEKVAQDEETTLQEDAPILVGVFKRDTLESRSYNKWFMQSYKDHALDKESVPKLRKGLEDVRITAFMGTWCEDSQREVPAFFKILDEVDYESNTVKIITVSEDKAEPAELVKNKNITNVPTFIFMKDGRELGRIVEYPLESLENDMVKILEGQEYKHAYAE